jgi:signal transduction histidine kinase
MKNRVTFWDFLQNKCFLYEDTNQDYIFKKSGFTESKYVQMRASLINNGRKVIVFFNDITKIKELEQISHRVRAMFLSSVAHELRTPLNSIIPMTALLKNSIQNNRKAMKYLEIITNSSLHL